MLLATQKQILIWSSELLWVLSRVWQSKEIGKNISENSFVHTHDYIRPPKPQCIQFPFVLQLLLKSRPQIPEITWIASALVVVYLLCIVSHEVDC